MAIGALSNTMNEWPLVALLMLALWLIARELKRAEAGPIAMGTLLIAGVMSGWQRAPNLLPLYVCR